MPTRPLPFAELKHTAVLWHKALDDGYPAQGSTGQIGALSIVARQLDMESSSGGNTVSRRLDIAVALGIPVWSWRAVEQDWAEAQVRRYSDDRDYRSFAAAAARGKSSGPASGRARAARRHEVNVPPPVDLATGRRKPAPTPTAPPPVEPAPLAPSIRDLAGCVVPLLRRGSQTLEQIAQRLGVEPLVAEAAVEIAHARGAAVHERSGVWHLDGAPPLGSQRDTDEHRLVSDEHGIIEVATVGDTHLCSKYAREDCLADFYDEVQRRGIKIVLHAGNWIDGEASFNRHDLSVHGMDAQMKYLADNYPRRDGVTTWAVAGADHEGWYSRREGVDVGRYAENHMRQAGRLDWVDLGYMEAFVPLVHAGTGKASQLCLMHPGGGSAYAISYAPQKIVEGFDGGDKPAVLVLGHYHKASYNLIRNVHVVQSGAFQDQTVFMRQKKIASHIAGCFMKLRLDPETGAVEACTTEFRNYFVRGYYRNRWSQHGPVQHAVREP